MSETEEKTQPEESPVLEQETSSEEEKELSAQDQAQALLAELKDLGIEKPEQVRGMATASSQAGNLGNMLGEARKEIAELKNYIAELSSKQGDSQQLYNEFDESSVDMSQFAKKSDIEDSIRKVYSEIVTAQQQAQKEYANQIASIRNDKLYPTIGKKFEQYFSTPEVQSSLATGARKPSDVYSEFKEAYLLEALTRSRDTIEAFASGKVSAPHIESGNTQASAPAVSSDAEKAKRLKNLTSRESGWTGDTDQLTQLVKEILPADDPILSTG